MQETAPGALAPEELEERIKDVHVLGIRSKMQLRGSALQHANKLLAVGCFCIGTNQVDLEVSCYLLLCLWCGIWSLRGMIYALR